MQSCLHHHRCILGNGPRNLESTYTLIMLGNFWVKGFWSLLMPILSGWICIPWQQLHPKPPSINWEPHLLFDTTWPLTARWVCKGSQSASEAEVLAWQTHQGETFCVGDRFYVLNFGGGNPCLGGTVVEKFGSSLIVKLMDGWKVSRHVDHVRVSTCDVISDVSGPSEPSF